MESENNNPRFTDSETSVYSFLYDEILIECPRCSGCAVIHQKQERAICSACGYVKEDERWDVAGGPQDSNGHTLWLRATCCGQELWLYNKAHLEFLEAYVAAKLREVHPDEMGWRNKAMASRLPKWISASKNRDAILKSLGKLKERLGLV